MQRKLFGWLVFLSFLPCLSFAQERAIDKALATPVSRVELGVVKANLFLDRHLREFVGTEWDQFDVKLHRYRALYAPKTKKVVLALRFHATSELALKKESCSGILMKFKDFIRTPKTLIDLDQRALAELFGYDLIEDPKMREELAQDVQLIAHITSEDEADYITCVVPYGKGKVVFSE